MELVSRSRRWSSRFARLGGALCAAVALGGCGGGDDEEDDRPQLACRYEQHSFTLCTGGSQFSSDDTRCTMVRTADVCSALTHSSTNCSASCCTDTTFRNVTVARGSC